MAPFKLTDKITKNFLWSEFLLLPRWGFHAFPTKEQQSELIIIASKLQKIREILKCPVYITSGLRPIVYNRLIGGADNSYHTMGKAVDFKTHKFSADKIRFGIAHRLDELDIRMEKKPQSNWVHIDTGTVHNARYFIP